MPELPEVETVRRGLAPVMEGMRVGRLTQRRPDLRFPFPERFAERVEGRKVLHVGRRAKYLVVEIEGGDTLVMHLGMSGRFAILPPPLAPHLPSRQSLADWKSAESDPARMVAVDGRLRGHDDVGGAKTGASEARGSGIGATELGEATGARQLGAFVHAAGDVDKHDHVTFEMSNGVVITYNDARRFGFMLLIPTAELQSHALFADIGVEPLGDKLTAAHLATRAHGRKTDLKAFLLDQQNIAGLGNIYVAEALYRARLKPTKPASILALRNGQPSPHAVRLVPEIKAVLEAALQAGGSTLRDYRQADGERGSFQDRFLVYGRAGQACSHAGCIASIKRIVQAGRSTFYCPKCQR